MVGIGKIDVEQEVVGSTSCGNDHYAAASTSTYVCKLVPPMASYLKGTAPTSDGVVGEMVAVDDVLLLASVLVPLIVPVSAICLGKPGDGSMLLSCVT